MPRDLTDKVILITGGSSGIGAATAEACAQAGMHISLVARRADKLEAVARSVASIGSKAHFFSADVANPDDMRQAVDECWDTFGRLDAVFANAGYGQVTTVMDMPEADERAMFETNYFGTMHTLRAALPRLRATEDGLRHMLVCSSAASEIGVPMLGVYAATKAAQDCVAGAMRAELVDEGIRVTSVHPIGTKTDFMRIAGSGIDSAGGGASGGTPEMMTQSVEHVARCIVKSLYRPKPEVWPSNLTRFGLALATAFPRLSSLAMRRHFRKLM